MWKLLYFYRWLSSVKRWPGGHFPVQNGREDFGKCASDRSKPKSFYQWWLDCKAWRKTSQNRNRGSASELWGAVSLYPPLRNQPDRQPAWAASEIQRRMVRSCLPEFVFFFKIRRIARKNIWHLPDVFRFHAESFARRQKRIFKCHGACRWIHGRDGRIYYKKRRRTPDSENAHQAECFCHLPEWRADLPLSPYDERVRVSCVQNTGWFQTGFLLWKIWCMVWKIWCLYPCLVSIPAKSEFCSYSPGGAKRCRNLTCFSKTGRGSGSFEQMSGFRFKRISACNSGSYEMHV